MQRLQSAPAVAAQGRIPVAQADAAEWLAERSDAHAHEQDAAPVVWHSIVRTYVDPAQRSNVEEPRVLARVWRLAYEPDPHPEPVRHPAPAARPGHRVRGRHRALRHRARSPVVFPWPPVVA